MESVSGVYRLGSFELSSPVMIAGNVSYINTRLTLFFKTKTNWYELKTVFRSEIIIFTLTDYSLFFFCLYLIDNIAQALKSSLQTRPDASVSRSCDISAYHRALL